MDLQDKNISLQFYKYLCDIVGSKEVVRTRRYIFTAKDIVESNNSVTLVSSGSKAEGLDLKGSDYDQMIHPNVIRVYESLKDVQYDQSKLLLVMETNDTKPGFTKLKTVNKLYLDIDMIHDWCETMGEETYISSKRCREQNLKDGMIIHGPCQSLPDGEYDQAICLRCEEWITPAQQWIFRSRTEWPHNTLVTSALLLTNYYNQTQLYSDLDIVQLKPLDQTLAYVVNMELNEKLLSLQFYNYLCDIIGSEEVVRTRRQIFTANDIGDNTIFANAISSGSKAEGLDLKGSDYDQMMQLEFIRVYESLNDIQSYPDKIPLVMVNNDTKPGFTKIKLVNSSYLDIDLIQDWCETVGEETYISSKRFREQHLNLCDELVMHGPCLSNGGF
ncbi:NIM1 [Mytilus coruscus]|uniref:NIM1 n=1 Tax=Mytilus coruscus TaxID=42192 RepID=A0A6J8DJD2_MYTCO|nr:NIM1 [Mytilus coruscus]